MIERICPWCREKQEEIDQDFIACKCDHRTEFCYITGFAIWIGKESKIPFTKQWSYIRNKDAKKELNKDGFATFLIGPHGDICDLNSTQRRIKFGRIHKYI